MKLNKTLLFAVFTFAVIAAIYIFDYRQTENEAKAEQAFVLDYDPAQINYIQITKPDVKMALQKSETGWELLEPFQDSGSNDNIENLLDGFAKSRLVSVVKATEKKSLTEADLRDFGLDKPAAIFNFKNNLGQTKIVAVGSIKNFEGNSYIRVDSEDRILIAEPIWHNKSQDPLIHYREVRLYRHNLAHVTKLRVKSLREEFQLKLSEGKWTDGLQNYPLDQNKVRELLKKISTTNIIDYVFEGEPSAAMIKEKGLDKDAVTLELETDSAPWSVTFNVSQADRALYALTERPTFLVKVDPTAWETFGNLALDQLRDRASALSFKLEEVEKFYVKQNNVELNLAGADLKGEQIKTTIGKIHDLKISEFVDTSAERSKFEGKNMLILKTDKEKLVLQLNWGPAFKKTQGGRETEYYYARTHLSDAIFALEKTLIDSLDFEKIKKISGEKVE